VRQLTQIPAIDKARRASSGTLIVGVCDHLRSRKRWSRLVLPRAPGRVIQRIAPLVNDRLACRGHEIEHQTYAPADGVRRKTRKFGDWASNRGGRNVQGTGCRRSYDLATTSRMSAHDTLVTGRRYEQNDNHRWGRISTPFTAASLRSAIVVRRAVRTADKVQNLRRSEVCRQRALCQVLSVHGAVLAVREPLRSIA